MNIGLEDNERNVYLRDIEYFSELFDKDSSSMLFMPMAYAYLKLGKYDEVISTCEKGLEHHSDYIPATCLLAEAFIGKGMLEEAKALLVGTVEVSPYNYRAKKLLGDILKDEGDMEEALAYYRAAQKLNPENEQLNTNLTEIEETFKNLSLEGEGGDVINDELDDQLDKAMDGILDNIKDKNSETERVDDEVLELQGPLLYDKQVVPDKEKNLFKQSETVENEIVLDKLSDNISFQDILLDNGKGMRNRFKKKDREKLIVSDNNKVAEVLTQWLQKIDSMKNN